MLHSGQVGDGRERGGSCSSPVEKDECLGMFFQVGVWQYCFDLMMVLRCIKQDWTTFFDVWFDWKIWINMTPRFLSECCVIVDEGQRYENESKCHHSFPTQKRGAHALLCMLILWMMLMNVSIVAPPSCCFAMFNSFTLAFTFTDGVLHFHMPHPSIHCFVSVSVFCLRGAICIGRLLTLEVLLLHAVLKEQWKLLLCCYVCAVGLGSCVCTHSDKWWCP